MINYLVSHVKGRLGATHRKLELDDVAIVKCLTEETLPTLSIYFPYYLEYVLECAKHKVPDTDRMYYLPRTFDDMYTLMSVEKVIPISGVAAFQGNNFNVLGNDLIGSVSSFLNSKVATSFAGAFSAPATFQFLPPNMIRLQNQAMGDGDSILVQCRVTHKHDFSTFPFGLLETVKKLALFDVSLDVYGIRKYFSSLNTTFADIQLNLDDLNVVDKRDDLIEKMAKNQLKNSGARKIIIR